MSILKGVHPEFFCQTKRCGDKGLWLSQLAIGYEFLMKRWARPHESFDHHSINDQKDDVRFSNQTCLFASSVYTVNYLCQLSDVHNNNINLNSKLFTFAYIQNLQNIAHYKDQRYKRKQVFLSWHLIFIPRIVLVQFVLNLVKSTPFLLFLSTTTSIR